MAVFSETMPKSNELNLIGNNPNPIAEQTNIEFEISQSGNVLVALSGMVLSDEDMFLFSQFSLMFTAKKMIDSMKGFDDTEAVRNVMKQMNMITQPKKTRKKKDE